MRARSSVPTNEADLVSSWPTQVVPRGLRTLLDSDYGDYSAAGGTIDQEIQYMKAAINSSFIEYERMAEAGKGLIWDVERLHMIIQARAPDPPLGLVGVGTGPHGVLFPQAYEGDLVKLKDEGSETKADINTMRRTWRMKFSACRRWQDFTRRSHVLKYQEELDALQDEMEFLQSDADKELEALLELIGTRRARDNAVKLTLFLKKWSRTKLYAGWRSWKIMHDEIQKEKFGERSALAALSAEEKLALMKEKEREAMLKCFLKRWANLKLAVPFVTWAEDILARRAARRHSEIEAEHAKLLARMKALEGSAVAHKLELIFARVAGKMKQLTFEALHRNMRMERIARLGEDEKFKRLKVFLEAKLKGLKYTTFHCLLQEYRDTMTQRLKHNSLAKRVGAFLEMKAKGIKFAQFHAFKRFAHESSLERAEEKRLAEIIAMRDSAALHRLKVFLQGKEARLKFAFFSFWAKVVIGSTEATMRASLHAKQKERAALEAKLKELEAQLGGPVGLETERAIQDADRRLSDLDNQAKSLQSQITAAQARYKQAEAAYQAAVDSRADDVAMIKKLEGELADARVDKEGLEQEFSLIVDQIGFLTEYSK